MKTLVKNATIITQNSAREIFDGSLVIDGSKIVDLGQGLSGKFDQEIEAAGLLVAPGFINAHVHLGESIFAPFITGRFSLTEYLRATDRLFQACSLIEGARETITKFSLLGIIASGTTTVGGGRVTEATEAFGLRSVGGYMLMSGVRLGRESEQFPREFHEAMSHKRSALTTRGLFIHSPATVDSSLLHRLRDVVAPYPDLITMLHVDEDRASANSFRRRWKKTATELLDEIGLLARRTLLVHGNYLTDSDIALIEARGVALVHCLSSSMRVAEGTIDLHGILSRGINVSLATDGVVTGSDYSALREAGYAYHYHNRFRRGHVPAAAFFDMVTTNPARAMGLGDSVGSIEVGKEADLVFLHAPFGNVCPDPIELLISYSPLVQVQGTMVAGKMLRWGERFQCCDADAITGNFQRLVADVHKGTRP